MNTAHTRPLADVTFRKSTRSTGGNNCVMVGDADSAMLVQDSKEGADQRTRTTLGFGREAFAGFVASVKAGELDLR